MDIYYCLLKPVDWTKFGIILAVVAVLAVAFAVLISVVSKLCAVKEDERAVKITEHLAGANCGGCGYAGCADYAKAISEGKAGINACAVTDEENKKAIAEIMGLPFVKEEKKFAVVRCNGGVSCTDNFNYLGNEGCEQQANFMGGRKACAYGCLGGGSCEAVCAFHAVKVKDKVAFCEKENCKACGTCVKKCPKHLIELIPYSAKVYVACSSECKGKDVMSACKNGCIGCGLCAKNCPEGAITMINNLPVIDYSKCSGCLTCVNKCPRKCIKSI